MKRPYLERECVSLARGETVRDTICGQRLQIKLLLDNGVDILLDG